MVRIGKTVMGFSAALVTLLVASVAHAQEVGVQYIERDKWVAIAAGLGLAIAAFGGALGQGRAAAAALEGISRNPNASDKLFTPMLLGLALIESLVIYSLIISFMLVFKIHWYAGASAPPGFDKRGSFGSPFFFRVRSAWPSTRGGPG